MKIFVGGTWDPKKAQEYFMQAQELGKYLALRGHILVASPSSGIQGLVAKAYKENNGREFIGYYPKLKLMEDVGEKELIKPDTPIYTDEDYPTRNLWQVRICDAAMGLTGGGGTLDELKAAIRDYNIPTAFFQGSSPLIEDYYLRGFDTQFTQKLKLSNNLKFLLEFLEKNYPQKKDL